jgi:hypothetical protein
MFAARREGVEELATASPKLRAKSLVKQRVGENSMGDFIGEIAGGFGDIRGRFRQRRERSNALHPFHAPLRGKTPQLFLPHFPDFRLANHNPYSVKDLQRPSRAEN